MPQGDEIKAPAPTGRIEINEEKELGLGAALYVTGYRIALLAAGAGALVIRSINEPGTYVGSPVKKLN